MIPPCRCLLDDMAEQKALLENIKEYIATLPEEQTVDEGRYRARLAICRACEKLNSGMCTLCGCYVEVRAKKKGLGCPDLPARWQQISE